MIQFTIGAIYYLIYNLGYYQIYGKNEYQSNTLMDLGITTFGSGIYKGPVEDWSKRYYLHRMYPKSSLDPDRNYLMHFRKPTGQDLIRNYNSLDLDSNKMITFQKNNYSYLSFTFGFIFPTIVCYIFSKKFNISFTSNIYRILFIWHLTNFKIDLFSNKVKHLFKKKILELKF